MEKTNWRDFIENEFRERRIAAAKTDQGHIYMVQEGTPLYEALRAGGMQEISLIATFCSKDDTDQGEKEDD